MSRIADRLAAVMTLSPDLDRAAVELHLASMGDDYLQRNDPAAVARHVVLAERIDGERPVAVGVNPLGRGELEVTFVGSDVFGEFALFSGLLAAHGLDIRWGHVHTALLASPGAPAFRVASRQRGSRLPAGATTRIVDTFVVRPAADVHVDPPLEGLLEGEALALVRLAAAGALAEARDRLNRRLAERLEATRERPTGILLPVEVGFDNTLSLRWTAMDVSAQDTPAFLYALANALSLRGVYVHGVEIGTLDGVARDRFLVADRQGGQITRDEDLAALRMTVGLIKQFTHFLPSAPDPAGALRAFDQLVDRFLQTGGAEGALELFEPEGLDTLARLLGSSRFLWEDFLRMQFENLAPLLGPVRAQPLARGRSLFLAQLRGAMERAGDDPAARRRALNAERDRALFAIDLKRVVDPEVTLDDFSAALTELVEAVLEAALEHCWSVLAPRHGTPRLESGESCAFAVCGLGKLGGRELGYASDIELLLVYGGAGTTDGAAPIENAAYFDAFARALTASVEARRDGIFEIDLRLRPYGRKGPLASALADLARYYAPGGDAAPFERQALVKLRRVAGDEGLGRAVEALRDGFVYGGASWDRDDALRLRGRQLRELAKPGEVNVKLGAGGLIDIEYAVQYLQIQHGALRPELRVTGTLPALTGLGACGVIGAQEVGVLSETYVFLRRVIDGLRVVRGDAKDLVLPAEGSDELAFLARRLGLRGRDWAEAGRELAAEVRRRMATAHAFYVARFGQP